MLNLRIATWDYDRIRPVFDGRIKIDGCNIDYICLPPEECFHRAYILKEFEVSEIGFIPYIIAKYQGLYAYQAIPRLLSKKIQNPNDWLNRSRKS